MPRKFRLAITMGDPAGVGPEICAAAAADPWILENCEPLFVGSSEIFRRGAEFAGKPVPRDIEETGAPGGDPPVARVSAACGAAAYRAIARSIELAVSGAVDAVVTAPINKAALHAAGILENGHTEIFAKATGTADYALMLYSPRICCAFSTCHESLARVPGLLSVGRVVRVAGLFDRALAAIGGRNREIALLGLNPHAGEEGIFGDEEIRILKPAAIEARKQGIALSDPLPPDTAFTSEALDRFGGHLCQYHDQGHIPFKMLSFHDGVNTTLGLPIVRTSVDHGTAFDIVGRGLANPSSLLAACRLATRLAASGQPAKE